MKVWIKLLIGSVLGFLLGFLIPPEMGLFKMLPAISGFAINVGRYIAPPLIVFSLTIAIYELRQDGLFWRLIFRTIVLMSIVSIFVIALGIGVSLVFPPDRIPIFVEQQTAAANLSPKLNVFELFPPNMLGVLSSNGIYLFPLCIFAFFMAIGLSYDKNYTKPILSIIDSLSRIFYHIMSFFSEILGVLMIVISAYWAVQYHAVLQNGLFKAILRILMIFSLVLVFIILPALLCLLKKSKNPLSAVHSSLSALIAAFFSGDINFTLPLLFQQAKENFGIRRRANTVTIMLWSTFGRAGSSMTAAIALMVIIKSYSSLEMNVLELLSIGISTFLITFLLARNSGDAVFAAITVLCARYGHGFETGYLILKPIAFYLISIGAFIDAMLISLGSFAVARISGFQPVQPIRR